MLFNSLLNCENKTYDLNDLYCTKEMPYFAHWKSNGNKKYYGIKLLMNIVVLR